MYKKLILWESSDNYCGPDYSDYYVAAGKTRDSDILTESNYDAVMEFLKKKKIKHEEVRFVHWACGWVLALLVHKDYNVKKLNMLEEFLDQDYPVLNESDYYDRLRAYAEGFYQDNYANDQEVREMVKVRLIGLYACDSEAFSEEDITMALRAAYEEACSYYGEEEAYISEDNIDKLIKAAPMSELLGIRTEIDQLKLL